MDTYKDLSPSLYSNAGVNGDEKTFENVQVDMHTATKFVVHDTNKSLSVLVHVVQCGTRYFLRINSDFVIDLMKFHNMEAAKEVRKEMNGQLIYSTVVEMEDGKHISIDGCSLEMFAEMLDILSPSLKKYIQSSQKDIQNIYDNYSESLPRRTVQTTQPVYPIPTGHLPSGFPPHMQRSNAYGSFLPNQTRSNVQNAPYNVNAPNAPRKTAELDDASQTTDDKEDKKKWRFIASSSKRLSKLG